MVEDKLQMKLDIQKAKIKKEREEILLIRETRKLQAESASLRRERAKGGFADTFIKGANVLGRGTLKATQGIAKFTERVAKNEAQSRKRVSKIKKKRTKRTKKILKKQKKRAKKVAPKAVRSRGFGGSLFDLN